MGDLWGICAVTVSRVRARGTAGVTNSGKNTPVMTEFGIPTAKFPDFVTF
ncbi:hypothetical protein HMPREF0578_0802 [Mobiluncus mulieris 28-1]|nr:hypothetical protein HMPREF0578_0802 [Mobiluncus mulieris 28-1]EFN93496.1 hypothetical protein HMPREF9278_0200 [Mobiluncus mulieris FB024-16]